MVKNNFLFIVLVGLLVKAFLFFSFKPQEEKKLSVFHFPYQSQGLTERQAAAHLLSRFTYGATPGQIDEVVKTGLENWFEKQLQGGLPDDSLDKRLANYEFLNLSNTESVNTFPKPLKILKMASEDGVIPKDSVQLIDKDQVRLRLSQYVKSKNIHTQPQLIRSFVSQRILRATYSNNQLQEVLTEFWFNHFNVALTKPQVIHFAPAYERDVIRPNVLGKFSQLLIATAKSPAMLTYLDNFISSGENDSIDNPQRRRRLQNNDDERDSSKVSFANKNKNAQRNKGLNENYAREVMELHTLGVDGGYTQADVTNAARLLTGWSIYPMGEEYGGQLKKLIDAVGEDKLIERGYIRDGDFFFIKSRHDVKEKIVLGKSYPENGGYQEGMDLLNALAHHVATAKFISKKIATYFVADHPSPLLINKMSKTFLEKDGDIKQVMMTMVNAPEFWNKDAVRQKTKSPFELVVSAARSLNAEVYAPFQVFKTLDKMGQKIYYYQAPTGFPDRADYWINTGALLNRMNFGIDIASQKLRGVKVDLLKLNNYQEPENAEAALKTYATLLLPERDMEPTIKRLLPLLTDPSLQQQLIKQSNQKERYGKIDDLFDVDSMDQEDKRSEKERSMLAQVVGIIIGSPEFQRR